MMIGWRIMRHRLVYKIFKLEILFSKMQFPGRISVQIITVPAQAAVVYESYILMLMVPVVV